MDYQSQQDSASAQQQQQQQQEVSAGAQYETTVGQLDYISSSKATPPPQPPLSSSPPANTMFASATTTGGGITTTTSAQSSNAHYYSSSSADGGNNGNSSISNNNNNNSGSTLAPPPPLPAAQATAPTSAPHSYSHSSIPTVTTAGIFSPHNRRDVAENMAATRRLHELSLASPLVARAVIAGGPVASPSSASTTTVGLHQQTPLPRALAGLNGFGNQSNNNNSNVVMSPSPSSSSAAAPITTASSASATTTLTIDDDRQRMLRTVAHVKDALSDRNQKISAAEKSLSQFATVCQRSSHRAEERIASHEEQLAKALAERQRQEQLLLELQREISVARRDLSAFQTLVEEDRKVLEEKKAAAANLKNNENAHEVSIRGSRARALADQQNAEAEIRNLSQQLADFYDAIGKVSGMAVEERQAHADSLVATRSEVTSIRRQQSDTTQLIQTLRKALSDAIAVEEEAVRRFNRVEAELDEEAALEKRIKMQEEASTHAEAMRELRTFTETQHDQLRANADGLRVQLLQEERRLAETLEAQSQLQKAIDEQQTLLSQLSVVDGRGRTAAEAAKGLAAEVKEQSDQIADYGATLAATNDRLTALRDTLGPLDDVQLSVKALREAIEATRTALADANTQHGVMGANRDEHLRQVNNSRMEAERVASQTRAAADESNEDTQQTAEAIKTQIRVLEVETATMEDNIRSLLHRNQTLANSLEEIDRHRKALEETLLRQKEEARRAAHALLVQLESQ